MADKESGRGRGGRGAKLAMLLAEMKRPGPPAAAVGPPSEPGGLPQPPPTAAVVSPSAPEPAQLPLPRTSGRGALLLKHLQQSETGRIQQPPVPQPVPSVSMGRGRLLQKEIESRDRPVPTPEVASVTQQFRKIQIDSNREPNVNRGTSGDTVSATANYIPLYLQEGRGIYEYEVRFNPQVDDRILCERMLFQQHRQLFGRNRTFDGVTMYLPHKLEEKDTKLTSEHPITKETHNISMIYRRERSMGECTHMYNVLFSSMQRQLNMIKLDREYYSQDLAHAIPQHKLEIWPGYITAVDTFEGGIMLNCNSSNKVVRTQTVLEIIKDIVAHVGTEDYKAQVQRMIVGQHVMTMRPVNIYRIDDIDFSQTPSSTFQKADGTVMDYIEYHKMKDIKIKDPKQPLLVHRPKANKRPGNAGLLMLVPELCYMTGLTDEMRSDFKVMKDIAAYTRVNPNQRLRSLQNFIDNIKASPACLSLLEEWGLKVPENTINLTARTLPPERIFFGRNFEDRGSQIADWSRSACTQHMLETVNIDNWLVVHTLRDDRNSRDFIEMMKKVCPQMGVMTVEPKVQKIRDDRTDTYLKALRECLNRDLQLVVVIFPSSRDDRYSAIKKLCCVDRPIPSQVINSRTISKPDKLRSIVQKIALQINCKMGGALWAVKMPFGNAMICGIDTYHDSKNRAHTVSGFVASMNKDCTRWHSQVFMQSSDREMLDGMRTALATALHKYSEVNNRHPEVIICYRDGVGDGQLTVCKETEVRALEKAFNTVSPEYKPMLAFVVCQKRINTRIFVPQSGGFANPPPGSIVDHTITRRYLYDFFLVSQMVRQGTVTPTHYIVLHNTTTMDPDKMQRLTYKMCHMYYNWPGTVRVPAPCQYAHKLAYLVGNSIHKNPAASLSDRLFFL